MVMKYLLDSGVHRVNCIPLSYIHIKLQPKTSPCSFHLMMNTQSQVLINDDFSFISMTTVLYSLLSICSFEKKKVSSESRKISRSLTQNLQNGLMGCPSCWHSPRPPWRSRLWCSRRTASSRERCSRRIPSSQLLCSQRSPSSPWCTLPPTRGQERVSCTSRNRILSLLGKRQKKKNYWKYYKSIKMCIHYNFTVRCMYNVVMLGDKYT